jgi:hypothetical protein
MQACLTDMFCTSIAITIIHHRGTKTCVSAALQKRAVTTWTGVRGFRVCSVSASGDHDNRISCFETGTDKQRLWPMGHGQ